MENKENKEISTPCYVFDYLQFKKNMDLFKKSLDKYFKGKNILSYSFKTNSLPYILSCVRESNNYAEVVSAEEYNLAIKVGFDEKKIVYNGPIKTKDSFLYAVERGSIVNIDSQREVQWLRDLDKNKKYKIGLRVNFDLEEKLPGQTMMGELGGRFGFCDDNGELMNVINSIRNIKNVDISVLHMHVSSKSKSIEVYNELVKRACEIARKYNLSLEYIDIGGGFFGGGDDGSQYEAYVSKIYETMQEQGMKDIGLIVEPGASLIATCVDYYLTVLDIKKTTKGYFAVTDGSRLHLDPFFKKNNYKYFVNKINDNFETEICIKQVVCGFTCMENDRILTLENSQKLNEGDVIKFELAGSYTMSYNNLFIRYLPRVYVYNGKKYIEIRGEWSINEIMQLNTWRK